MGLNWGPGAGVRKICSLLCLLGTSSESDVQGQKPGHDRKIKKYPVPRLQSHWEAVFPWTATEISLSEASKAQASLELSLKGPCPGCGVGAQREGTRVVGESPR